MINHKAFFDKVRGPLFSGSLSQSQVDGMNAILDEWDLNYEKYRAKYKDICIEWLAYMLATAYHETGSTMQPIEEWGKGKGLKYGNPAKNGKIFYGRGFVQLTWDYNYQKAGKELGADFYNNPELVMELRYAVPILYTGMMAGWFTGKKLSDYLNFKTVDFINARRIINGTDKAAKIAAHALEFLAALK